MSDWNHSMCADCWSKQNQKHVPKRDWEAIRNPEFCCFCGRETYEGIFVRRDPRELKCKGAHPSAVLIAGYSGRMWRLIRDFVLCETSQTSYAELKGSQALCEFAEEMGVKLP
jgi:hypothetical protein